MTAEWLHMSCWSRLVTAPTNALLPQILELSKAAPSNSFKAASTPIIAFITNMRYIATVVLLVTPQHMHL